MAEVKTNQQQEKKAKKSIKLDTVQEAFPKLIETAFADTQTFGQLINSVFSSSFAPQYYGSKIVPYGNRIDTTIYFMDRGANDSDYDEENGPYKAIEPMTTKGDSSLSQLKAYNRFHMVNGYHPKFFKLTDVAKSVLSDFAPRSSMDNKGNVKWDQIVVEETTNNGYGSQLTLIGVKIDFVRLIKRVYGTSYDYSVMVGNPIGTNISMINGIGNPINNWQLFIVRASKEDIKAIAKQYGFNAYNRGIVTD